MASHFHRGFVRWPLVLLGLLCIAGSPTEADSRVLLSDQRGAPQDEPAQISEYVRKVFQDRDGHFWFGTNSDGVARYDGSLLTFITKNDGLAGNAVREIVQDTSGAMWFATDGGIGRLERGTLTNYTEAQGLPSNEVWSMMLDKSGTIWVGTLEGVCRFDGTSFVPFDLPRVRVESPASRFSPKVVFGMAQDHAGNIWFGTDGEGAHKYDGKTFTSYTTAEGLAGNEVRCVSVDRRGRVWIGTDGGGVSCYDGKTFRNFTAADGLNNDRVFGVLEDNAGNIWFSTLGAGACRYDGTSFTSFQQDRGLTRSHVQSMLEDRDGALWFGCSGGLFRLNGPSFVNVTRSGPWPVPALAEEPEPMARFARFMPGTWRQTAASGTSMLHTWHWGPGHHSIRRMTDGLNAAGEPWREVQAFFWHPGRKQLCSWGVSAFAQGVSEGTMTFDGVEGHETADAVVDLYQT